MPSNDSSRTEHPGDITSDLPNRCDSCGHHRREHALADGACGCSLCVGFVGPPDSASSSPNDTCAKCGHWRELHDQGESHCRVCHAQNLGEVACGHAFAPAEPETECQHRDAYQITGDKLGRPGRRMGYVCEPCGEVWMKTAPKAEPAPEAECIHLGKDGCCYSPGRCAHGCKVAADELSQQTQDMEPECSCSSGSPENYEGPARDCPVHGMSEPETPVPVREDCGLCGEPHDSMDCEAFQAQLRGDRLVPRAAPRRPPYAVAYAIEGGAQYEIALPGDASVRAVDGALLITHDSAVLALSHVRPMEGQ